jgi:hypothetical protein
MKKTLIVLALLVAMLAAVGIAAAAAQEETPETGSLRGPLHDYIVAAFADRLDLDVDEVETAIDSGQTLYQIALANGVSADDFPALMREVRSAALDEAVADGVISRQRAERMRSRGELGGGRGTRGGNGVCPMRDGDDDAGSGPGRMRGSGRGGGGRWWQTNP